MLQRSIVRTEKQNQVDTPSHFAPDTMDETKNVHSHAIQKHDRANETFSERFHTQKEHHANTSAQKTYRSEMPKVWQDIQT